MCLLGDVNKVRLEIEATFKQYARGEATFEIACTVANIGFGIIRRACERFVNQHPQFGDYADMLDLLGLQMERCETLVVVFPKREPQADHENPAMDSPSSEGNEDMRPLVRLNIETASLLCASGADIMLGLRNELHRPREGYDARRRPPNRHGFAQLLHDNLPELLLLKSNPNMLEPELGWWYGDEFLSGMMNYTLREQHGLGPIWLAVVTQCYRNIYDILGGNMQCGQEADTDRYTKFRAIFESVDEFAYCTSSDGYIIKLRCNWPNWFKSFENQFVRPRRPTHTLIVTRPHHPRPPVHLIGVLPTVTAGTAFSSIFCMYAAGCAIANTNFVVHCAAHFYAACRFTGLVSHDLRWRDMDFFLEHHDMYTEMVPGADPYVMINNLYRATGFRRNILDQAKVDAAYVDGNKIRWIEMKSKLTSLYFEALALEDKGGSEKSDVNILEGMLERLAASEPDPRNKSPKRTRKGYSPIKLLSVFKEHFVNDEPQRNFNMVGFSQQCSDFIRAIRKETSFVDPNTASQGPHDLAAYVLSRASQLLGERKPASDTLLPIVARVLEKTVADCGDTFRKDAYERSSKHLLPEQRPQLPLQPSTGPFRDFFGSFVREGLGKARNWVFEDSSYGSAIYQADGTLENFQRLAEMYRILYAWSHVSLEDVRGFTTVVVLVEHLQAWAGAGLDERAVPLILVELLAMGREGAFDQARVGRARQWLAKLVRGS